MADYTGTHTKKKLLDPEGKPPRPHVFCGAETEYGDFSAITTLQFPLKVEIPLVPALNSRIYFYFT